MLWLSVQLPRLPLEVFTRGVPDSTPLVVSAAGRPPRLVACNAAASALGLSPGMTLESVRVLAADAAVRVRDPAAEGRLLARLAAWAGQFTPHVSLASAATLLLEVAGSLTLFGGAAQLQEMVATGLDALGHHAVLAMAPTPLAALWLARGGVPGVIPPADLAAALAALPLAVLDLDRERHDTLRGMGLRSLGDCLALPRAALARRLGPQLIADLDRALGRLPDPRPVFSPPPRFAGRLPLPAEVVDREALLFPLHRLVLELAGLLRGRGAGVQMLGVTLLHGGAHRTAFRLALANPSRDPQHLLGLLRERLERLVLPAPVRELRLAAPRFLPLVDGTRDWLGMPGQSEEEDRLVERLRARLGDEAVRGLRQVAEHRPERAWCLCAPGEADGAGGQPGRPFWLLPEPLPLTEHQGRPWLGGPLGLAPDRERIESGWWDGGDIGRDYFIARDTAGARYWVYRELAGARHWFLHGVFD